MRLSDQPAVLEWFPTEMKSPTRPHAPIEPKRRRMNFDTVAAASQFAVTNLSDRDLPEITTVDGITLRWADIAAMGK